LNAAKIKQQLEQEEEEKRAQKKQKKEAKSAKEAEEAAEFEGIPPDMAAMMGLPSSFTSASKKKGKN
jgi:hypothetical protein